MKKKVVKLKNRVFHLISTNLSITLDSMFSHPHPPKYLHMFFIYIACQIRVDVRTFYVNGNWARFSIDAKQDFSAKYGWYSIYYDIYKSKGFEVLRQW